LGGTPEGMGATFAVDSSFTTGRAAASLAAFAFAAASAAAFSCRRA